MASVWQKSDGGRDAVIHFSESLHAKTDISHRIASFCTFVNVTTINAAQVTSS